MAKQFLRSGSLDAVLPLGENGQPVYLSALQLRETLRLRKQQQIADCLAIPQPNDAGDRLDWYSPVSGKVISWAAASDDARAHALNQLVACQQAVADLCQRAQRSEKNSQKLFGALLAKAIQFPDQNFVYLVGGKPVLTFWGFVSLEKKGQLDPLECLRAVEEDVPLSLSKMNAAAPLVATAPAVKAAPPVDAPAAPEASAASAVTPAIAAYQAESSAAQAPAEAEPVKAAAPSQSTAKRNLWRYGWIAPAIVLLAVFGIQISKNSSSPPVTKSDVAAPENAAAAPAIAKENMQVPIALPVAPATVAVAEPASPAPEAQPAATTPPAAPAVPAEKDDLVLPAEALKLGSTRFMNGNWRVIVDIKTPLTGKPPVLRYQLRNGKGQAQITQGDGTVCRAEVYAGVMKSGSLVINSRTRAKCSDGSRYRLPELSCVQGAEGTAAACSGQYDTDNVLPMTMKRESK